MEVKPIAPHYDVAFKAVFSRENLPVIADFLEAVPGISKESIEEITVADPHLPRRNRDDKLAILDLRLVLKNGEHVNVELQVVHLPSTWKRIEYQNSRLLADQLSSGEEYKKLHRAITIVISYSEMLLKERPEYHFRFVRYDPVAQVSFPGSSEIHVLQVKKVLETDTSPLGTWLRFFKAEKTEEFEMVSEIRPALATAWGSLKDLSADPAARRLADAEEMQRRDMVDRIEGAREEALEEGIEIGREEGKLRERQKTVLQLLGLKWSHEAIADFTGMPIDQVRALENSSS